MLYLYPTQKDDQMNGAISLLKTQVDGMNERQSPRPDSIETIEERRCLWVQKTPSSSPLELQVISMAGQPPQFYKALIYGFTGNQWVFS